MLYEVITLFEVRVLVKACRSWSQEHRIARLGIARGRSHRRLHRLADLVLDRCQLKREVAPGMADEIGLLYSFV